MSTVPIEFTRRTHPGRRRHHRLKDVVLEKGIGRIVLFTILENHARVTKTLEVVNA